MNEWKLHIHSIRFISQMIEFTFSIYFPPNFQQFPVPGVSGDGLKQFPDPSEFVLPPQQPQSVNGISAPQFSAELSQMVLPPPPAPINMVPSAEQQQQHQVVSFFYQKLIFLC